MNRNAFDSLDREGLLGVALALAESNERLIAKVTNLEAEVARLQAKQDRPPKTPNNSSVPPSQGHKKTTEFVKSRRKKKPHPGAHRPLHPNPTHRRDVLASACGHCGADVSGAPQAPCEVYARIEIPPIAPEITRVGLHGGVCPCCAGRFKAEGPRRGWSPAPRSAPTCAPSSSISASPRTSASNGCRAVTYFAATARHFIGVACDEAELRDTW